MVTSDGSVKIIDYGLAVRVPRGADGRHALLEPPVRSGKRVYQPPEVRNRPRLPCPRLCSCLTAPLCRLQVFQGLVPYDAFAFDRWSLGIIAFSLSVGNPPFEAAHITDSRYRLVQERSLGDLVQVWGLEPPSPACLGAHIAATPRQTHRAAAHRLFLPVPPCRLLPVAGTNPPPWGSARVGALPRPPLDCRAVGGEGRGAVLILSTLGLSPSLPHLPILAAAVLGHSLGHAAARRRQSFRPLSTRTKGLPGPSTASLRLHAPSPAPAAFVAPDCLTKSQNR